MGVGGPAKRWANSAVGAMLLSSALIACGGDPPQIVDYSPQRNTADVSTAVPIRIIFDHDVDQSSVASRLRLNPPTIGSVRWIDGRHLVFDHVTLYTSTNYEVILEPGYRDLAGNTYTLRHHWSFVTQGPPSLAGSMPRDRDTGVDPASYLRLDFSRAMDPTRLKEAVGISPSIPFEIRLDQSDSKRATIAPSELLKPNTDYQLLINVGATDINGNQLGRAQTIRFTTGPVQPLQHWIAFSTARPDGSAGDLWIVNEEGFPRKLFAATPVQSFTWSPAGESILVQGQDETWHQFTPGGGHINLTFKGPWAAALASGRGYVYIDDSGVLHRQRPDGGDDVIATDVAAASVAPNGLGRRIAYLRHDINTVTLRVRALTGAAATTTLTSGEIGRPAWLPDSTHLVFAAEVTTLTMTLQKAFVINVVSPPASLNPAAGLPSDPSIEVSSPVASPDGHQIAFLSGDQVWLMNADGTRPTALTGPEPEVFPYSCRALAWTRT